MVLLEGKFSDVLGIKEIFSNPSVSMSMKNIPVLMDIPWGDRNSGIAITHPRNQRIPGWFGMEGTLNPIPETLPTVPG